MKYKKSKCIEKEIESELSSSFTEIQQSLDSIRC